jgi:hypothetical protein
MPHSFHRRPPPLCHPASHPASPGTSDTTTRPLRKPQSGSPANQSPPAAAKAPPHRKTTTSSAPPHTATGDGRTAGLIAAYQLGYGIAALGAGALQNVISLSAIFRIVALLVIAMAVLAVAIARRQHESLPVHHHSPTTSPAN